MEKRNIAIFSILLIIILGLVLADVWAHPNFYTLDQNNENIPILNQNTNENQSNVNENKNGNISSTLLSSQDFEKVGIQQIKIEDVKAGKDLFGMRIETLTGNINKRYMYQDDFPIGIAYELESSVQYAPLLTKIQEKIQASPVWTINPSNTFGKQSVYLNNSNRPETTFVLIGFENHIIGFEYPKNQHQNFTPLFESLKFTL